MDLNGRGCHVAWMAGHQLAGQTELRERVKAQEQSMPRTQALSPRTKDTRLPPTSAIARAYPKLVLV
jgi:hypothetical protein